MKSIISLTLTFLLATLSICSGAAEQERKASSTWIERPWQMRYFLRVKDAESWQRGMESAAKWNAELKQTYFLFDEFFSPKKIIPLPDSSFPSNKLATILIEFDKDGFVTTPNTHPGPLRGRLNQLSNITLSAGDGLHDKRYDLAHWFMGLGDGSELFAPGLCAEHEYPSPFGGGRYDKGFKTSYTRGGFGCREWAYQLYDDERPYIDVTSYERKTKLDPHGTYIREFIGWARFGDKKPIIGKDSNTWICLLDCPNGEQPGIIPDIKAWASKNGWSVPKRPKKQPQFPDSDFRSRKYEFD